MDIAIRVDSSIYIGSGHVMRCLALANELRALGYNIRFATRPQNGDLIDYIRQKGFAINELPQPREWLKPLTSADYLAWLQVPIKSDIEHFCAIAKGAHLVVVDHYALDDRWEREVKKRIGCKIVAIDDLARKHCADIIVDQTLYRSSCDYTAVSGSSCGIVLTGTDYALLNTRFSIGREQALDNDGGQGAVRLLLSLGGIDKDNITIEVLKALLCLGAKKPRVTVILGEKSPSYETVRAFCANHTDWLRHIAFVEDMADIMLAHSIAIGAPGTTSWERACLGIPSLIIPLAENQSVVAASLVNARAAILVEPENIKAQLAEAYQELVRCRLEYRLKNLSICDGLGVKRVADYINSLLIGNAKSVFLRRALASDIHQVYVWQCKPETRKYALTKQKPTWDSHQRWMEKKLLSTSDFFYMVISADDKESIGVVRLDRVKRAEYLISIFLSSEYIGKGFGKKVLQSIDNIHQHVTIYAKVLKGNVASQRLFLAAGYHRVSEESFIRTPLI